MPKEGNCRPPAEVGSGTIDWKAVLETAEQTGVKHYFVERDNGSKPPFESLRISYQNLSELVHKQ